MEHMKRLRAIGNAQDICRLFTLENLLNLEVPFFIKDSTDYQGGFTDATIHFKCV
jgi:hypothetical protein